MFEITGDNLTDIYLTRGDTAALETVLNDYNGVYKLNENDTLTLSVRKTVDSPNYAFQVTADENGVFTIAHDKTADLECGRYVYDIQLETDDGEIYTVIFPSVFEIGEEVTR